MCGRRRMAGPRRCLVWVRFGRRLPFGGAGEVSGAVLCWGVGGDWGGRRQPDFAGVDGCR